PVVGALRGRSGGRPAATARRRYGSRQMNVIVSYLAGPRQPYALCGSPIRTVAPVVGLAPGVPVGVGILRWADHVGVGVLLDDSLASLGDAFVAALRDAFDRLSAPPDRAPSTAPPEGPAVRSTAEAAGPRRPGGSGEGALTGAAHGRLGDHGDAQAAAGRGHASGHAGPGRDHHGHAADGPRRGEEWGGGREGGPGTLRRRGDRRIEPGGEEAARGGRGVPAGRASRAGGAGAGRGAGARPLPAGAAHRRGAGGPGAAGAHRAGTVRHEGDGPGHEGRAAGGG